MSNDEESIFSSSRLLTDEEFQKYRDLSKPGESHELLKSYVGNWTYESTVRMEPNGPEYTGQGTSCYCTIMEGRFVKGCYVGAPPPKSSPVPAFSGFELIGFSNVRNEYQATWIDNMSTLQSKSSGKYDKSSNKLLMEGCHDKAPDEMGVKFRTVTSFPSENQMIYELYSIDSKTKEEFRTLHLKSTRRKSPTHISSVSIISLLTDDIDATRDWYCEKLGFMVKKDVTCDAPSTDRWCVIKPPQAMKGASISITNAETQSAKQVIGKQAGDGWLLVLETNDIQSDFEELKKKGVKFEKDKPEEKSYGIDIVLFDPLGNKINLVQCNKCKSCK